MEQYSLVCCLQLEYSLACGGHLINQPFNFGCKCRNNFYCAKIWFKNCSCEICDNICISLLWYSTSHLCGLSFMEKELESNDKPGKAISKALTIDDLWNWINMVFINIVQRGIGAVCIYTYVYVHIGNKETKTPPDSALGMLWCYTKLKNTRHEELLFSIYIFKRFCFENVTGSQWWYRLLSAPRLGVRGRWISLSSRLALSCLYKEFQAKQGLVEDPAKINK